MPGFISATGMLACVNGALRPADEAAVSVLDHGLLYGDGLFETLRVMRGQCFLAREHLARLRHSAERLHLRLPWSDEELIDALHATAAANRLTEGALRLTVTRGSGPPIPNPEVCEHPSFLITARPGSPTALDRPLSLATGQQHPRLFVPGIKSLCYLPLQLARVAARTAGFDDALLEYEGMAVETTVSNFFLVRGDEVLTPPLESGCLPGITRGLLLRLCVRQGIPAREAPLPISKVRGAMEAFVTNSLQGVVPVGQIGEVALDAAPGPVTLALAEAYRAELAAA